MKTIAVKVTRSDTKKGKARSRASCPVAIAINRATSAGVLVYSDKIFSAAWTIPTPKRVAAFIERFDAGLPIKPISFNLRIPGGAK